MIKLHLSDRLYSSVEQTPYPLTPWCGQPDGRGIIRRGSGEGLVSHRAISREYHCAACVAEYERLLGRRPDDGGPHVGLGTADHVTSKTHNRATGEKY